MHGQECGPPACPTWWHPNAAPIVAGRAWLRPPARPLVLIGAAVSDSEDDGLDVWQNTISHMNSKIEQVSRYIYEVLRLHNARKRFHSCG